jgi:heme O synthase-like polyprenyltransferase
VHDVAVLDHVLLALDPQRAGVLALGLAAEREQVLGALLLGSGFVWYAAQLALRRSNASARRLLRASIFYLPALLVLWMFERASA